MLLKPRKIVPDSGFIAKAVDEEFRLRSITAYKSDKITSLAGQSGMEGFVYNTKHPESLIRNLPRRNIRTAVIETKINPIGFGYFAGERGIMHFTHATDSTGNLNVEYIAGSSEDVNNLLDEIEETPERFQTIH